MAVPGPDEDIALAITFQIDCHSFYDEKMTGIGSAVRDVHPKIISNRVADWFIAPDLNDQGDNRNAKHVRHFSKYKGIPRLSDMPQKSVRKAEQEFLDWVSVRINEC